MNKYFEEQKTIRILKRTILVISVLCLVLFSNCVPKQKDKVSSAKEDSLNYPVMTKYTIALYGTKAEKAEQVQKLPGNVFLMEGIGSFTWKVNIPKSDDYEVVICYAADRDSSRIQITGENSSLTDIVHKTEGYYYDSNIRWQQNFERIAVKGTFKLSAGENTISFSLVDPIPRTMLYFRGLELNPVSAKMAIKEEVEKAIKARSGTDWLAKAGYGLMLHWTSKSQPEKGERKSFPDAVRDFNVDAFADLVEQTGAGYVLFTNGHAESYCPAPISAWEKIHPGMTTKRDLLMELSDKLNERGIKFMIYMNSPRMANMGKVPVAQYMENHREILTEIGERYGSKIAGYAFDSWYQGYEEYPDFSFEELFRLCKIGYPDRLVAFNTWILPVNTPWQDFWFGETYIPGHPAQERIVQKGPGRGLQYHSLIVMENLWVHENPAPMETPWLNADNLSKYIRASMQNGGAVTINVGIYQEGTFGEESLEVLRSVKKLVRGK
jgi:hypothetical protein